MGIACPDVVADFTHRGYKRFVVVVPIGNGELYFGNLIIVGCQCQRVVVVQSQLAVVSIQDLAFHTIAVGEGDATLLNGKRSACPIVTHIVCRTPIYAKDLLVKCDIAVVRHAAICDVTTIVESDLFLLAPDVVLQSWIVYKGVAVALQLPDGIVALYLFLTDGVFLRPLHEHIESPWCKGLIGVVVASIEHIAIPCTAMVAREVKELSSLLVVSVADRHP